MTDNLTDLIAKVIAAHECSCDYDGPDGDCNGCTFSFWKPSEAWKQQAHHLAAAIVAELGPFTDIPGSGMSDNPVKADDE